MNFFFNKVAQLLYSFVFAALIAGCDDDESRLREETKSRLVGTWLRQFEVEGIKIRHVIRLSEDGNFHEETKIESKEGGKEGGIETEQYSGDWYFDGKNFKRRYRILNGKPAPSASFTFATYELTSITSESFEAVDHVEKRNIRYRKIEDEIKP